ncbi:hypothetical protein SLA2020_340960 [Shorea laevis]
MWNSSGISKVASYVRKPIAMDRLTPSKLKLEYAHVLVNIIITNKMLDGVPITEPNAIEYVQPIIYGWKPTKCSVCGILGHEAYMRRRKKDKQDLNRDNKLD